MATGDDASAAGMDLAPGSTPANTIHTEINKTRDYIAGFFTAAKAYADGLFGSISLSWASITGKPAFIAAGASAAAARAAVAAADSGTVSAQGGYINNIANGLLNAAPWDRNITWTRRAAWLGNDGTVTIGHTASRRAMKQNITPAALARDALTAIPVVQYRYRAEVAKERLIDGYRAAVEIGTLADDLHALGLWQFVVYEGRGEDAKPVSVHYELLGLAGIALGQILATELDALAARVAALEARDAPPAE